MPRKIKVYRNGRFTRGPSHSILNQGYKTAIYEEIEGDILLQYNSNSCLIVQINDCIATKAHPHTFNWHVAEQFPYANPYAERVSGPYKNVCSLFHRPNLGTIKLFHDPEMKGPSVVCCFSQYRMCNTTSYYYINCKHVDEDFIEKCLKRDEYEDRLHHFHRGLQELSDRMCFMDNVKVIAIPKYIGCGMAGGVWEDYEEIIQRFCRSIKRVRCDVVIHIVSKKT